MALTGNNTSKYIGHLCLGFLSSMDESIGPLEDALVKMNSIHSDANNDLQSIYLVAGLSPIFHEAEELVKKLENTVQQLQDMVANAMVGKQELRKLYSQWLLMYQTA